MADAPSIQDAKFWTPETMSTKNPSLVPGVNDMGNRRPKARVKGGKTKEVKASMPVQQSLLIEKIDNFGGKTVSSCPFSSDISTLGTDISTLQSKSVTLKDLCAEDKKRIAHLIKELAKVGEEKENAEQNLNEERKHYQEQIMVLVRQQEAVLKEREDVQNRLLEYQSYIVKLQQQQQLQQLLQHQQRHQQKKQQHEQQQNSKSVGKVVHNGKRTGPSRGIENGTGSKLYYEDGREEKVNSYDPVGPGEEQVEQPSTHLYMNETIDQSGTMDGLSTQVLPSQSPPPQAGVDTSRPLPHRPFTALIDKQLDVQRKKASAVTERVDSNNEARFAGIPSSNLANPGPDGWMDRPGNFPERKASGMQEKEENWRKSDNGFPPEHEYEMLTGAAVSPEKMAIFSRFMDSQTKAGRRPDVVEDRHQENPRHVSSSEKDGEKKTKGERKPKHTKGHHSSRPPASYPGFYPPIMSSTQKSSEIGDYIDSTIVSDRRNKNEGGKGAYPTTTGKEVVNKYVNNRSERHYREDDSRFPADNYVYDSHQGERLEAAAKTRSRRHLESSMQGTRMKVDFMESVTADEVDYEHGYNNGQADLGVDTDFLCYYKNLSASERKQELLKQRSVLLEEQNKLRQLLVQQQEKQIKKQQIISSPRAVGGERNVREERRGQQEMGESLGPNQEDTGSYMNYQSDVIVSGHGLKKGRPVTVHKPGSSSNLEANNNAVKKSAGRSKRTSDGGKEDGAVLKGKDGDECVTYSRPGQPGNKKDNLVKKLDYSLCSDAGEEGHSQTSNLDRKFIVSPTPGKANALPTATSLSATRTVNVEDKSLPGKVDAGTSISFATVSENLMEGSGDRKIGSTQTEAVDVGLFKPAKASTNHSAGGKVARPRFSESPGDKTLAILKIINALPGENPEASPVTRLLSPSHKPQRIVQKHSGIVKDTTKHRRVRDAVGTKKPLAPNRDISTRQIKAVMRQPERRHLFQESAANVFGKKDGLHVGFGAGLISSRRSRIDTDLDSVDFSGWKEDRIDGYRRIISGSKVDDYDGGLDTEGDDTFYDYNDDDDSNIDDIVTDLLLTSEGDMDGVEKTDISIGEDYDEDDDVDVDNDSDEVDFVVKGLNFSPQQGSQSSKNRDGHDNYDFHVGSDGVYDHSDDDSDTVNDDEDIQEARLPSVRRTREMGGCRDVGRGRHSTLDREEKSILEDIFFVSH